MVGTFDSPNSTKLFPSLAANHGFKAISLKYPNLISASQLCRDSGDVDCYTKFHEELIYGTDDLEGLDVNASESIYNRILKLLIFLDGEFPSEGWDVFLTSDLDVAWNNIVLSGHSQGGGHAAYLGKNHQVDRVITFASPNEFSGFFQAPAPWLSDEGETTDDRFYAFANIFDDVVEYEEQYLCWDALNMTSYGDTLNVDQAMCPFNNTHLLFTSQTSEQDLKPNHSLMIIDDFTPIENGKPVFESVWEYLLDVCIMSSTEEIGQLETHVFPNPASQQVTIESSEVIKEIIILDTHGNTLLKSIPNSNSAQIDVSDIHGLFFVKLTSDSNQNKVFKLIVH